MYQWYGDSRVLVESYHAMTRYVEYLGSMAKDNIVSNGLGDWFDIGPKRAGVAQLTPVALTATAFYYRDLQIVAESARLLGRSADAAKYDHLARVVADSFNRTFYHPPEKLYATNSQTANAIPVVVGLAPPDDVPAIVDHIVADMKSRGGALTAGDVGYRFVLQALADNGRSDEIFTVNNQSERPGYGYQLAHGATSLIEAWNANLGSSQDHFMLGHILEWFYRDLAGIQPDPNAIAFDRVIIKPAPVGDITWVKSALQLHSRSHRLPVGTRIWPLPHVGLPPTGRHRNGLRSHHAQRWRHLIRALELRSHTRMAPPQYSKSNQAVINSPVRRIGNETILPRGAKSQYNAANFH